LHFSVAYLNAKNVMRRSPRRIPVRYAIPGAQSFRIPATYWTSLANLTFVFMVMLKVFHIIVLVEMIFVAGKRLDLVKYGAKQIILYATVAKIMKRCFGPL
jgi:hypothetical protein